LRWYIDAIGVHGNVGYQYFVQFLRIDGSRFRAEGYGVFPEIKDQGWPKIYGFLDDFHISASGVERDSIVPAEPEIDFC